MAIFSQNGTRYPDLDHYTANTVNTNLNIFVYHKNIRIDKYNKTNNFTKLALLIFSIFVLS